MQSWKIFSYLLAGITTPGDNGHTANLHDFEEISIAIPRVPLLLDGKHQITSSNQLTLHDCEFVLLGLVERKRRDVCRRRELIECIVKPVIIFGVVPARVLCGQVM